MMNKQKTSLMGLTKYALSIPLFAFFLLAAQAWGLETLTTATSDLTEVAQVTLPAPTPPAPQAAAPQESRTVVSVMDVPNSKTGQAGQLAQANKPATTKEEKPLNVAEEMPEYPGGEAALVDFISKNLRYPAVAQKNGIQGRSIIRFVIDAEGNVTNVEAIRPFNEACDAEAVRVIKTMPRWKPGRQDGRNIPVYYTMPIVFKLQGDTPPPPPTPTTLVNVVDGQSTVVNNAAVNKEIPLIIVDNIRYQVVGLDLTKASEKDILKALNLSDKEVESVVILKGKAAEQLHGKNTESGVIMITTKKQP